MVFCEGKNSEPDYVKGLKKIPEVAENTSLKIELDPEQGTPMTLVERAVRRKRDDTEVDECWCIFDVESPRPHPNLARATNMARDNRGVFLAISNPCFELWLTLHWEMQSRPETTDDAERRSRKHDKRAGKSIDAALYMPLRKVAAQRAEALEKRHSEAGTLFPNDNPSSGMHRFLRAVDPSVDAD